MAITASLKTTNDIQINKWHARNHTEQEKCLYTYSTTATSLPVIKMPTMTDMYWPGTQTAHHCLHASDSVITAGAPL